MVDFKKMTTGALPKSSRDTHKLLGRVVKSKAKEIVAERLLAARELNGYSQTEAAALLQYASPAQLSQWEQCRRAPPMHMLMRASAVYRVSMDYLTGVCKEPDRDPASVGRRQVFECVEDAVRNATLQIAELAQRHLEEGGPTVAMSHSMLHEGEQFHRCVVRFIELNKEAFEDMRGGAPLIGMAERFEGNCLAPARNQIERFKRLNGAADARHQKQTRRIDQATGDLLDPIDA